jgi:glycosyltransferase involved in cell wall biosynthesis
MKKTRVLHILGSLNPGGVETWLLHLAKNIDKEKFEIDFLVNRSGEGFYENEIVALGSKVLRCNQKPNYSYPIRLIKILKSQSNYDVIHSHVYMYSGVILTIARLLGIKKRIAHSHNDHSILPHSLLRNCYRSLMRFLIRTNATNGLAASNAALKDLFGESDPRFIVHTCALDFSGFKETINKEDIRSEFGFNNNDFIVGHIGRFVEQKNHDFLIDIFFKLRTKLPNAKLLLIGEGKLKSQIHNKIESLGLESSVVFAGIRRDIPRIIKGAFDCFLLPSLHEGLGLVAIEAQAGGIKCVLSDQVPKEACVVPELVSFLPLNEIDIWVDEIINLSSNYSKVTEFEALNKVISSPFSIQQEAKELQDIYLGLK